jgi:catechol 2,3-dioxygenase-like lactoylglutathione lyase family enzyme
MADVLQAESLEASLTVGDLDRSAGWYCDALGLVIDRRHERDGTLAAVSFYDGLR